MKRNFTLIEVLVSMAILSLIASVIGIGYGRAQKQELFLSSTRAIAQKLQTASQLMLLHGADIQVKFDNDKGILKVNFETDAPRKESAKALLKDLKTKGIEKISFTNEQGKTKSQKFTLLYSSIDSATERGVLEMETLGVVKRILILGYPQVYKVEGSSASLPPKDEGKELDLYPKEIRERFNALPEEKNIPAS